MSGGGDDDLFALLDQANSDKNDDSPAFPLPSERKQSSSKGRGKRRRPPARKPMISLDKLLDSDSSKDNNDLGWNSDNDDEPEVPKKKGKTVEKLEMALKDYISHAIDKVRQEFVSELTRMLDNSQEEQSMISTFILGLPGEMEQAVADEIALGRANDGKRDGDKLQMDVESLIESLWRVIPRCPTRNGENITVRSLANKIVTSKTEMATGNDEILSDLQNERSALVAAREQLISASENANNQSTMRSLRMEIEANAKRLDVEEQYNKMKRKRLEEMQREWRERQTGGENDSAPDHVILRKLESMANMAPRSKIRGTITVLGALLETTKRNYEDMRNVRVQLELELESLSYAMRPLEEPIEVARVQRKMRARRPKPRENVIDEAREKLAEIRKSRHRK